MFRQNFATWGVLKENAKSKVIYLNPSLLNRCEGFFYSYLRALIGFSKEAL